AHPTDADRGRPRCHRIPRRGAAASGSRGVRPAQRPGALPSGPRPWPGRRRRRGGVVTMALPAGLPPVFAWTFVAALAAVSGSFLNVCISRLPAGESIVSPPSHCPRCQTPIRYYDNIPLLSFALLRGRCRTCRIPISWRYPIVEALAVAVGLLALWRFGLS